MALRLEGLLVTKPKGLKAGSSESESWSLSSAVALVMTAVDALYLVQPVLILVFHDKDKQVLLDLVEIGEEGWWLRGRGSRGAQARAIFSFWLWLLHLGGVDNQNQRFASNYNNVPTCKRLPS